MAPSRCVALKSTSEKRVLTVSYEKQLSFSCLLESTIKGVGLYLTVVKGSVDGNTVDILIGNGSHLLFLDGRYSSIRVQNVDRDVLLSS